MSRFFSRRNEADPKAAEEQTLPRLLWERAWDLLFLNLICFVLFLPFLLSLWLFFTQGASLKAVCLLTASALLAAPARRGMARTVRDLLEGRCYEPVRGFFRAFADEYFQSVALGLFYHLSLAALLWGAFAGLTRSAAGASFGLFITWLCAVGIVVLLFTQFFAYSMLANVTLSISQILRNAALLGFARVGRTLLSLLIWLGLTLLCLVRFPYLLCLLPLCYFSLVWFFCGGLAWKTVKEQVARPAAPPAEPE